MEIVFLAGADADLQAIYTQLGEKVFLRIDRSLELVRLYPEIAPQKELGYRRKLVPGTYLGIYYQVHGSRIFVAAILDQRIDPETIRKRLG